MWHSEADIVKDLISLDDFGVSKADESYKVLYSFGRGFKAAEKPTFSNPFIDPRTGNGITLSNNVLETSDTSFKSKGRGSTLCSFSTYEYQLQKQLRLARPIGSSDSAIEAYYGRNKPAIVQENSTNTLELQTEAEKPKISANISHSPFNSLIDKMKQKGRGTRNSNLQHNVVINNLLSKCEIASGSNSKMENFEEGIDEDNDDPGGGSDEDDVGKFDTDMHVKKDHVNIQEKIEQSNIFASITDSKLIEKYENICQRKLSPRIIANFSNHSKNS